MPEFVIPSTWFVAFHTHGREIPVTDTLYLCDHVELGRYATLPAGKRRPPFFMINLATGGGRPSTCPAIKAIARGVLPGPRRFVVTRAFSATGSPFSSG